MYILAYFYHSLDFFKHSHQFWIIFVSPIFVEKYPPIFLRYLRYIRKIQVPIYLYLPIFQSLTTPISIGHLLLSLSLSFRVGTAPILIGRLHVSSVSVFELGPHLYRLVIHLVCLIQSWDRTYIDRSLSYQFESEFFGSHLYRSTISLCSV